MNLPPSICVLKADICVMRLNTDTNETDQALGGGYSAAR